MRLYLSQLHPIIGDLDHNFNLLLSEYKKSVKKNCDFFISSELSLVGYTPEDLLLQPHFIKKIARYINKIKQFSQKTVLLLSTPWEENGKLYNAVLALQNGMIIGKTYKKELPNYGIFDEKRYFTSGKPSIIKANGYKIAVPICEDIWDSEVVSELDSQGAEMFIAINASPFEVGKYEERLNIIKNHWNKFQKPFIYCNQVLGIDGIVYDGRSFGYDGNLKFSLPSFQQQAHCIEIENNQIIPTPINSYTENDLIYGAIVFSIREYIKQNGFNSVIVGLSGGIDSTLVTVMATDALGPENVSTVMLPSKFTSPSSFKDAYNFLNNVPQIKNKVIPINKVTTAISNELGNISELAYENVQSRSRGLILMAISNNENSLLLTTGNKSEVAVGYCTIYGDMCGAFNPLKDLYKTKVWELSTWRNNNLPLSIKVNNPYLQIIPQSIIEKEPTAELKANHKDSDSLPEYQVLDEILNAHLERCLGLEDIISLGYNEDMVQKVINMVKIAEHKRWQAAPGTKITKLSFGKERRFPISHHYTD